MEPLTSAPTFTHAGVQFHTVALYRFLEKSPHFLNPVNRLPFTEDDLQQLETAVKLIHGPECIVSPDDMVLQDDEENDDDDDFSDDDDEHHDTEWLDPNYVEERTSSSVVGVRLALPPIPSELTVNVDLRVDEEEVEDDEVLIHVEGEDGDFHLEDIEDQDVAIDELPPPPSSLPGGPYFASLVEMFRDEERTRRLTEEISLTQYLEYEVMSILMHMVAISKDLEFQRLVWTQTSNNVMNTVNQYLQDSQAPPELQNYNLHVVYSRCWRIYRELVLHALSKRYTDAFQDLRHLSRKNARLVLRSHQARISEEEERHQIQMPYITSMLTCMAQRFRPFPAG